MFGLFEQGAESIYIYQIEVPIILSIIILTLFIFYSLDFFKKH